MVGMGVGTMDVDKGGIISGTGVGTGGGGTGYDTISAGTLQLNNWRLTGYFE